VFLFLCIYILQVIFYIFVKLYSVIFDKAHVTVVKLKEKLFFGGILELLLESYLELVITGYLNSKAPIFTSNGDRISAFVGYFSLFICCFCMPAAYLWMLKQPLTRFNDSDF